MLTDPPLRTGWRILLVATFVTYFPALQGAFVWDDVGFIVQNRILAGPHALYTQWFTTQPIDYWPITYTVLWLARQAWGLQTGYYHVLNILLHSGCAVLVWRIARRLGFRAPWLIALLFAVHPVNVQAVAWIFQIKTLLAAIFFFGSILAFLHRDSPPTRFRWTLLSLLLFTAAMLSKSSPLTLPVVLLLLTTWTNGLLRRADVLATLPLWTVAIGLSAVGVYFQRKNILPEAHQQSMSLWSHAGQVGQIAAFYLRVSFLPWPLMPIVPKWPIEPVTARFMLPTTLLLVGSILLAWKAVRGGRSARAALVLLSYFLLMLLPVLGIVNIVFFYVSWVADHYLYLALPAVCATVVEVGCIAADRNLLPRQAVLSALVCVAVTFAAISFRQCGYWTDNVALWSHQVSAAPDEWQGQGYLAGALSQAHRYTEARPHAWTAVQLAPSEASPHDLLGRIDLRLGDETEATRQFTLATRCRPPALSAFVSLARSSARRGDSSDAEQHDRDAIGAARNSYREDGYAPAETDLAGLLLQRGQTDAAVALYRHALLQEPKLYEAHLGLGNAFLRQHQTGAADREFQLAHDERPDAAVPSSEIDQSRRIVP